MPDINNQAAPVKGPQPLTDGYISSRLDQIFKLNQEYKKLFYENTKVLNTLDDDFLTIMEEQADRFSSQTARENNKDMAFCINYLKKIVEHKSQLYTFDVSRTANVNQDLVDAYTKLLKLDSVLNKGNYYFNGTYSVLLEFYRNRNGLLQLRTLTNNKGWVFSDDIVEPNKPTAYIKVIRTEQKQFKDGGKKDSDLLQIWTDTEVMLVYTNGEIVSYSTNIYGVAPFVYVTTQPHRIMPASARDTLHNIIQINNIYTGGNVNNHWLSNPVRVLKNVDETNLKIGVNPNDFLILNGRDGSQLNPEIDELASTIDLDKAFQFAKNLLQEVLYTHDIKNKDAVTQSSSGLELQLKDTDMLESRKNQIEQWRPAEEELWHKLAIIHNSILDNQLAVAKTPTGRFDDSFEVEVEFPLPDTNNQVVQENNANPTDPNTNQGA